MKKKIITICLVVALAATVIIGGTMAYFTDTAAADNVFEVGGVAIELHEQQRNEDGTALVDFEQGKELVPIVGSAQTAPKDQFGLPMLDTYVDKIVTVENTEYSDAYVRAYFAIPSALDDGYETFNASLNILHFNFGNYQDEDGNWYSTYGNQWIWKEADGSWKYFETNIDGIPYNVYYADYYRPLAAGETTEQFIQGVYLDKNVDYQDGKYIYKPNPEADLSILSDYNYMVCCPVAAVAVQAKGFESVSEAVDAAFGAYFNPWADREITVQ